MERNGRGRKEGGGKSPVALLVASNHAEFRSLRERLEAKRQEMAKHAEALRAQE
jgi:hypothetical protein